MFRVDYIQAVEPDELPKRDGIRIIIEPELDGMGFNRVAVCGESREAVLEYVREAWGDEDPDWFREWIADRIEEFPNVQLDDEDGGEYADHLADQAARRYSGRR